VKGSPIRILHLEDNAQDAELAAYAMESEGMNVSISRVEDKAGYIEALREGAFDLILSDYSLPAFNGSDALELAKEIRPDAPFIFVSGKMGEDLAVESLQQGAMDYVLKRLLSRLPPAVERALQQARTRKEKLQAEAELGKTQSRLAVIVENSKDSIWSVDAKLRLMTFNPVAATRFRASRGIILKAGLEMEALIPFEEKSRWMGWFLRAMAGEDFHVELSYALPALEIDLEVSINPIPVDGAITGVAIFSRDITERKKAQRQILRQRDELEKVNIRLVENQAQLIQSEKRASLGQLSAGVAHEINNPMAFVTSNLRTLASYARTIKEAASEYGEMLKAVRGVRGEMDASLAEARVKAEKRIQAGKFQSILDDLDGIIAESLDGAQRVNEIVHGLKNMARVDKGQLEPTDINRCLEDALKLAWNELKYKCTVEREFGDLPMVQGHPGQLKQVFINLLVNAAQAIPEKGTIYVRTARKQDRVIIEIEDTGTGIAEENMSKLFTPFFTTKPAGQGTGLGLPISYGIIQGMQGGMDVRSKADAGTTFVISLPVQDWTPSRAEAEGEGNA
jgi:two-component system, NtrC family, sensor kinase